MSDCGGPDICVDDLCRGNDYGICGEPSAHIMGEDCGHPDCGWCFDDRVDDGHDHHNPALDEADPWHEPEQDPGALRYELDGCVAEIARLRATLTEIVDLYRHRPETRSGGAVAIALEALGEETGD